LNAEYHNGVLEIKAAIGDAHSAVSGLKSGAKAMAVE